MIVTKNIEIIINKGNISFYKEKYSVNIGDKIIIDIKDLSIGSNLMVTVKCDFCGAIKDIKYRLYNRSVKNHNLFSCSRKCASNRNRIKLISDFGVSNIALVPEVKERIKETNISKYGSCYFFGSEIGVKSVEDSMIRKYGVYNPQMVDEIKKRTRETNIDKYGASSILSLDEIREKIKLTNIIKYGNEIASKSSEIISKIKETNNLRYGGNSPMSDESIREKSKNKLLKNYGVTSPQKSEEIRKKTSSKNLETLGVEYPSQSPYVKEKIREKILKKYGTYHTSHSEDFRKEYSKIANDENYLSYKSDGTSIFKCDKNHTFEIETDNYIRRKEQNINLCTICNPIGDLSSIKENEFCDFIKSIYGGEVIENYRDGIEIDVYLPNVKVGFEFNGLYWHSIPRKDKNYHLNKTNFFKSKGIRLIHIWEDDWLLNRDLVEGLIKNVLGLTQKRVFARKCNVRYIDSCSEFLFNNHLQGPDRSSIKIGLYNDDDLVSVMTFNKFEGRKKLGDFEWNLSRFCSKRGISVIGGASKMLRFFVNEYKPKRIISYSDKDWSVGGLYFKLGFVLVHETKPDYKYVIGGVRKHKQNFKKSNLKIENKTEREYMKIYDRIYDCGKIKFQITF